MAKPKSSGLSHTLLPHAHAFHGLAGRTVHAIEPHTEASSGALLMQFLAAFGFVVGRCAYYLADGARHYPNLFVVLVGESAKSRKGTSWNRVRDVFESLSCWPRDRVTTGLSSGEGLIASVAESADKRLLVIQTEFGSALQVMARSGNTLSPVLRDAWDGTDLRVMTKNNPISASGAHLAIIAHTTANELAERLQTNDVWNGFANRFLWCVVSRARLLPHGGDVDGAVIKSLVAALRDVIRWAHSLRSKRITWEKAAKREWESTYTSLAEAPHSGALDAVTARAEAQIVRLALLYALLDKCKEIRTEHLRAALAIWKFCESSARQVFGSSTGDGTADRIHGALRSSDHGLSRTEISKLFDRHRSSVHIGRALDLLKQLGLAECRTEKGIGRSTERWLAKK